MAKRNDTPVARRKRIMLWSLVTILVGALALPMLGYLYASIHAAQAQATDESNPRANYWRAVRDGLQGYTAVEGQETNVLMQSGGQTWREIRNGPVANYGGWVLFVVAVAIMLFYAFRGRLDLEHGRSGQTVKRWSGAERFLHWYTAILFIVLAVTGLSLLFGRAILIPLLGPQGFAAYAQFSKTFHNYIGPFFSVGVLLMILFWIRHNLPSALDFKWFAQGGGGIVGNKHASAGRMNAGEKVWFWLIATVGVAVIVTGFILDFPNFGQTRELMQIANVIHGSLSLVWVAMFFGHVYIGTIGSEGSLEAMTTGKVDVNWAKQHHDLWYAKVKDQPVQRSEAASPPRLIPEDSILRRHYESTLHAKPA